MDVFAAVHSLGLGPDDGLFGLFAVGNIADGDQQLIGKTGFAGGEKDAHAWSVK